MLIAHVNFTYPWGKLPLIFGQFPCIAGGGGSGGVINRCIIGTNYLGLDSYNPVTVQCGHHALILSIILA